MTCLLVWLSMTGLRWHRGKPSKSIVSDVSMMCWIRFTALEEQHPWSRGEEKRVGRLSTTGGPSWLTAKGWILTLFLDELKRAATKACSTIRAADNMKNAMKLFWLCIHGEIEKKWKEIVLPSKKNSHRDLDYIYIFYMMRKPWWEPDDVMYDWFCRIVWTIEKGITKSTGYSVEPVPHVPVPGQPKRF